MKDERGLHVVRNSDDQEQDEKPELSIVKKRGERKAQLRIPLDNIHVAKLALGAVDREFRDAILILERCDTRRRGAIEDALITVRARIVQLNHTLSNLKSG